MTNPFIYLDYNATTPTDPRVGQAMGPYLTGFFGNPSSSHRLGREARAAVDEAREKVALCLGAAPEEILFTSGGTEANNLAIRGAVTERGGGHVITSAVEHPAVLEVVRALEAEGMARLTIVGVDRSGRVDPEEVRASLEDDTVLVSIMLANNEVGTLEPVAEIAELCHGQRGKRILVHTDAAQGVGKVGVNVDDLGVDLLSVAGHKLYAPKGIGALYLRRGVTIAPVLHGASHEGGLRPGTENVLEQVGLGEACSLLGLELDDEIPRLAALRDRLLVALEAEIEGIVVHGNLKTGLPNTLSVALPGVEASPLLGRLGDEVAASAGAACHSGGEVSVSHVLAAMGIDAAIARSTIRLSVGRMTTEEEVDEGAKRIIAAARHRDV